MKEITVSELNRLLTTGVADAGTDFINVCTPAEYKEKHIGGVRNVPLDELPQHRDEFTNKKRIYVHCRSGKRGARAIEKLRELGVTAELINVAGGQLAWEEAGLPTNSHTTRLPIMRQVMLAAGSLVLLGNILYFFVGEPALYLSLFVGAGLFFAGATGWCGMAFILAKMPWNK